MWRRPKLCVHDCVSFRTQSSHTFNSVASHLVVSIKHPRHPCMAVQFSARGGTLTHTYTDTESRSYMLTPRSETAARLTQPRPRSPCKRMECMGSYWAAGITAWLTHTRRTLNVHQQEHHIHSQALCLLPKNRVEKQHSNTFLNTMGSRMIATDWQYRYYIIGINSISGNCRNTT